MDEVLEGFLAEWDHVRPPRARITAGAIGVAGPAMGNRVTMTNRPWRLDGDYLAERFAELKAHPLVGTADTCGFVGGITLVKDKETMAGFDADLAVGMICRGHCFKNGLIMRAVGDRMIIAPPLVMTRAQIDEMMVLIRGCLDATLDDLRTAGQLA